MSTVETRLAAVEARLSALEARLASPTATVSTDTPTDTFSDDMLDRDWADKLVSKELPRWKGDPMSGRRYSDCPAEWHDSAASFCEWKAKKGREETPVRMKNNGKPWHESDTFEAKLHRTWAKRIRSLSASAGTDPAPAHEAIDELPF